MSSSDLSPERQAWNVAIRYRTSQQLPLQETASPRVRAPRASKSAAVPRHGPTISAFPLEAKGSLARKLRHALVNSPISAFKLLLISQSNVNWTIDDRLRDFQWAIECEIYGERYPHKVEQMAMPRITSCGTSMKRKASSRKQQLPTPTHSRFGKTASMVSESRLRVEEEEGRPTKFVKGVSRPCPKLSPDQKSSNEETMDSSACPPLQPLALGLVVAADCFARTAPDYDVRESYHEERDTDVEMARRALPSYVPGKNVEWDYHDMFNENAIDVGNLGPCRSCCCMPTLIKTIFASAVRRGRF